MNKSVYIETSIPSFYYETRDDVFCIAMREWTRDWWKEEKSQFDCFISEIVINELQQGNYPCKQEKLDLIKGIKILDVHYDIENIVEEYIRHYIMPQKNIGDALHLAMCSFYKIDFLLTWNCQHLANANKKEHIRKINDQLNIFTPELVTPYELIEEKDEENTNN